jgi:site-specific DNA-cytosine methylase
MADLSNLHVKKSLELFSGSKTVSSVLQSFGFDAWSVDKNPKLSPRISCDILNFDYSLFPGQFDFIWASPDCRYFSRSGDPGQWLKEVIKYRQYKYTAKTSEAFKALLLVYKTIEIIQHYSPVLWVIENPVGRMRHISQLQNFAPFRYGINYKDFGFSYSKETDLYSNIYLPFGQEKVIRPGPGVYSINSRYERSRVPGQLVEKILEYL